MLKINQIKRGVHKFSTLVVVLSTILWSLGSLAFLFVPVVQAVDPSIVGESQISSPTEVKGSSVPTAAVKSTFNNFSSDTLVSVTVSVVDAGSTGFATTDLAALANSAASGIALYDDLGTTVGSFDAGDALATLSGVPTWTGTGPYSTTLTLATPVDITGSGHIFWVVFRTASGLATDTHQFVLTVPTNSIVLGSGTATHSAVSTSPITIDAVAPADLVAGNFAFTQSTPPTQDQLHTSGPSVSIGANGDILKVYAGDGTTLIDQATIGPTGSFTPVNIGNNLHASVKVQAVDDAGNVSNMIAITGNDIVAPTVTSASAFTDRMVINFSENVDGMMVNNCANYTVNGSALTCGGLGNPYTDFRGNKLTIKGLTLSGTATLVISSSNTITDINGGHNSLTAYSSGSLTVTTVATPAITSISPSSGAVGATVTISGSNFGTTATPGDENHKVFFSGGFSSTTGPLPPVEADYTGATWSATSITVKVPSGAQGGPLNVMVDGVMSDPSENSFFDISASYTAKIYYDEAQTEAMPDGDAGNIRIMIASGQSGPTAHYVGDGSTTYNADTDTFTITNVGSMGWVWAFDATGDHLNATGREINISATQKFSLIATTRKVSGTITLGASCVAGGQNKSVVVMAISEDVDFGDESFSEIDPSFFTTNGSCQATYAVGIPINGSYRIEAHLPPQVSGSSIISAQFTDPNGQLVTITDSSPTATGINFTFEAATHKIVGQVQKASGEFSADEKSKLWIFAYQPREGGKGTGTQVAADGSFTVYVTAGTWKVGVGGENISDSVEVQVDVDSTYLIASYTAAVTTIVISPPSDFIEGTISDSAGNGLSNVSLYAWREGGPGNGHANTDSQGYYKMYVSAGTNYHVGAHSQTYGFLGEQSGITVSSSTHPTVNFSVSSSDNFTISGTVTKSAVGLQQAFVFITENENGQMLGSSSTDSSGAYTARVSGGSNRWIHVGLPGKGEVYKENLGTISANTTKNIAITSSIITVRISPPASFTQAFVGAHSSQGDGFSDTDVSSEDPDTYREYKIEIPRPTSDGLTYYVEGGIPGYGSLSTATVVVNSDGTFVETSGTANDGIVVYTLSGVYTVSGTVTGDNVEGAWIWVSGSSGGGGGEVAADGTFSIKLKNGTYDIGVSKPEYIGNKTSVTVNGANATVTGLALSTSDKTITGTVYLPDGTTTVTNAWVWADNGAGGWAGGSTDASGAYTLNVAAGSWMVRAAYDGYNSSAQQATAPDSGVNITLAAIAGFSSGVKNQPVTPSDGGIVQGDDITVDFPKNSLGTDTSAGTIEVKTTTNVPETPSVKIVGSAKEITARNSSNQNITTLSGTISITLTLSKQDIIDEELTFAELSNLKISYWDSTANAWSEIPTVVTLNPTTATDIDGLDSDPAVTLSGTTSHLSAFALTEATDADAPPTPTGFSATAGNTQVALSWTASSGATKYDIYWLQGDLYAYLAETTSTSYTKTGLTNGTQYSFKVSALNDDNNESAATSAQSATPTAGRSSGGGGTAITDTTPPTNTSVSIASGASSTTSVNVTLTLAATDASHMMISNDPNFVGASWENYAATKSWTLLSGDGVKTVYAKFKDASGNISTAVSDTITLGTSTTETPVVTETPTITTPTVTTTPTTATTGATQLETITSEASLVASGQNVTGTRDTGLETRYSATIVARLVVANTPAATKARVLDFVTYGTSTTRALGAGERGGVVNSFQSAFGKLPTTEADWSDVLKIANGRWPSVTNQTAENRAKLDFKKVYKREASMSSARDNAAVTIMAYGLRQPVRKLASEKVAIRYFTNIYKTSPKTAAQWDVVRAIAYSGASR